MNRMKRCGGTAMKAKHQRLVLAVAAPSASPVGAGSKTLRTRRLYLHIGRNADGKAAVGD